MKAKSPSKNLLFISYAYEDEIFARWLSRKLALFGYGVWFDQIKLLGGESWVDDVDVAIKDCSFRVLAILSKSSISKENPRKERTLALQLGKERRIDDFLVTINLDGCKPDWTLSDISWISFQESWAHGLRRLLKKLDSIHAPRIHCNNPSIARVELDRGECLISQEQEDIIINWLPFTRLPQVLDIYENKGVDRKDLYQWPSFSLGDNKVASFSSPPSHLENQVQKTSEVYHWQSVDVIYHTPIHSIIVQILNRTVAKWLSDSGCKYCKQLKLSYIPNPYREESIVRYFDADGAKRRINTFGKCTIKKPAGSPEKVYHHPGIRYRTRRTDCNDYIIEIKPALALFDEKGLPLEGKKIGSRQKKITRSWYNPNWRKRFMVFAQILKEASVNDDFTPLCLLEPIRLTASKSLIDPGAESSQKEVETEPDEEEVDLGLDELEDWND